MFTETRIEEPQSQPRLKKDGTPRKEYDTSKRPVERTDRVSFRVTPEEKLELQEIAAKHGLTITELVLKASRRVKDDPEFELEILGNSMSA
ncbi:MAG: hypothetical protein KME30_29070 [Iphinoe sp. HA4291-MV1]|jgi:hypothetical protein|nr:hypothetical protein [Iphinoe sp. HA4291-MV1]